MDSNDHSAHPTWESNNHHEEIEFCNLVTEAVYMCLKNLEDKQVIFRNFDRNSIRCAKKIILNLSNLFSDAILRVIQEYEIPRDQLLDESEVTPEDCNLDHIQSYDKYYMDIDCK